MSDTTVPAPLSPDEIANLFVTVDPPKPGTYELALVLGGTVSAGAYTAGALDYLFEALDIWTTKRDTGDPDAPKHRVQIRVITGTSGGGVNAAIAARALGYVYNPVSRASPVNGVNVAPFGPISGNPFYDVWCKMLTLDGFLDTSDLQGGTAPSILNGKPIDDAADYIATFATDTPRVRSYLGEPLSNQPLRLILTVTNLHGIPYRTVFAGAAAQPTLGESFVDHADHLRFAVAYWGRTDFTPRPDEMVLTFEEVRMPRAASWPEFSYTARATAAFPIGFPARVLSREMLDYRYRVVVLPADASGTIEVRGLTPDWAQLQVGGTLPGNYSFVAVDGGATDNEPIMLARTALCGVTARNPRTALEANRGVLLIDPFSGEAGLGVPPGGLVAVATGTLNTLLQQTRYDTADLVLAADPTVFSRFLVSANRGGIIGSKALATGGVSAFVGFACPAFMRHDYLLGRANCQQMLMTSLGVSPDNPVVKGKWTPEQITANSFTVGGQTYVRLIPLFGNAAVPETTDPWPVGALAPNVYRDAIEKRWRQLLAAETENSWWTTVAGWLGGVLAEGSVADWVIGKIKTDLQGWGLLPPTS